MSRAAYRVTALGLTLLLPVLDRTPALAQDAGQEPAAAPGQAPAVDLPKPAAIPGFELPALPTIPVRRGRPETNWVAADNLPLPKDRDGIWVLEFSFLPVRIIEVDIPGKGRRPVHYMVYKVVNRSGQPRQFVPQFTLIDDSGKRYEDTVLPLAARKIQATEDPSRPLLGAVASSGTIPASTKNGIDDAVFGVAIWDNVDFKADGFHVFVRGLSDGYQQVAPATGGEPVTRFKALKIDFSRHGDDRNPHSAEIKLREPAYEWVYYP